MNKFYQGVMAAEFQNTIWVLKGYRWYVLNRHREPRRFDLTYNKSQTVRLRHETRTYKPFEVNWNGF